MERKNIYDMINEKANEIFYKPVQTYKYENLILGCPVVNNDGKLIKMYAVAPNTWRAFHKINKSKTGASHIYKNYFIKNKEDIINRLKNVKSSHELDEFEEIILSEIRIELTNILPKMLRSYNRLRKPIDLYIEHIVSMAMELENYRERLIPLLFLPIDSEILSSEHIFEIYELNRCGLNRKSSYGDINNKQIYDYLQELLIEKVSTINKDFNRIFFDLFWNDRYLKNGGNLFQTN